MVESRIEFSKADSFKDGIIALGRVIWKILTGAFLVLKWSFNYAAPIVSIVFLISVIKYAGTLQYAIGVESNGTHLDVIQNEATYNQAQALVQDKLTYTEDDQTIIVTPKFSVMMLSETDNTVASDNLSELIIGSSNANVTEAYSFYINGELIGVYSEEEKLRIKEVLELQLGKYYSADTAEVSFTDNVVLSEGRFIDSNLTDADEAIALITSKRPVEAYYVVQKGDSVSLIASKLDITQEELLSENPFLKEGTHTGDLITYHYSEPYLSVMTTHYENYDRKVEREVVYRYTSSLQFGCEYMYQSGSGGEENVTALVTEINGVDSQRVIVSRTVIEEMVPRVFVTGTAKNTNIKDLSVIEDMGTFCWPVGEGGYVSSYYGWRDWDDSYHRGLDIAAKRGTEIYAVNSGKVTYAARKGTFGKLVIIDHGDGIETYYSHMNAIHVSEGDWVEKGDLIGEVGMTGSASGSDLPLALRIDGHREDPELCLGGTQQAKSAR